MSMVEKVAEAIFLKEGRAKDVAWRDADKVLALVDFSGGHSPGKVSDYYRSIALAAIEAMREPTEAMDDAADAGYGHGAHEDWKQVWRLMIDAALAEK